MKKKNMQRIDAPQVEHSFEKAAPEDTPGYIACGFPTLFPFGTGDYHASRGAAKGRFDFATWGKHVLQYHDQRFMRHNRDAWSEKCLLEDPLRFRRIETGASSGYCVTQKNRATNDYVYSEHSWFLRRETIHASMLGSFCGSKRARKS